MLAMQRGVNVRQAAGFTTGSNSSGYTLQSVTVKMANTVGTPTSFTAAIHAESGSSPGNPSSSATHTLIGPTSPVANAQNTWSCAGVCSLDKSKTYFLVLSATAPSGDNRYRTDLTSSNNETNTPADAGWSIADVTKYSQNLGNWTDFGSSLSLQFKVTATPKVRAYLTASGITDTTATLHVTNPYGTWWRQWWYQRATPSGDTTCHSVAAGLTAASLSTLTASTSYTYKAYDASGCNDADEIASVTFATTPTTVSNLGETKSGTSFIGRRVAGGTSQESSQAAGFTTGSNSSGYKLQSVTVKMGAGVGAPTGLTAAIHVASGGNPAASATYTLSGDAPTSAGEYTYTCAGTCSLNASTGYFLVLSATVPSTGNHHYRTDLTTSDAETNMPANAGWSIANAVKYSNNGVDWNDSGSSATLKFKVTATPK